MPDRARSAPAGNAPNLLARRARFGADAEYARDAITTVIFERCRRRARAVACLYARLHLELALAFHALAHRRAGSACSPPHARCSMSARICFSASFAASSSRSPPAPPRASPLAPRASSSLLGLGHGALRRSCSSAAPSSPPSRWASTWSPRRRRCAARHELARRAEREEERSSRRTCPGTPRAALSEQPNSRGRGARERERARARCL